LICAVVDNLRVLSKLNAITDYGETGGDSLQKSRKLRGRGQQSAFRKRQVKGRKRLVKSSMYNLGLL